MSYIFDPEINIKSIWLVGLGGTGSQLARSICRMLYDMRSRSLQTPKLHFIDPDTVELKNVGRQMFTAADVGQHKAEVLARRFNRALGLDVTWRNTGFRASTHIGDESWHGRQTLIVGAVDNHLARKELAQANCLWLDCGNHYDSGQVVIGNTATRSMFTKSNFRANKEGQVRYCPNAALVFPQLLEPSTEPEPELSCADLVQRGDQHLLINDLVANVAAQYVYKLLHRQPIKSFMTFVDAEALSMRSVPVTYEDIQAYIGAEQVA